MSPQTLHVQRKSARYAAAYGAGRAPEVLAPLGVTPKRARKLLKAARRDLRQPRPFNAQSAVYGGRLVENLAQHSSAADFGTEVHERIEEASSTP
jgi:hypothetical protein